MHEGRHIERRVEEKDPQGAVEEEEGYGERAQVFDVEEVEGKQWLGDNPAFDVYRCSEKKDTNDEERIDIRCCPAMRSTGTIGDSEDNQNKPRRNEDGAGPVHLNAHCSSLSSVRGNGEVRSNGGNGTQDRTNEEVPSPVTVLRSESCEENTGVEAEGCARSVDAEYEVFTRTRAVDASE